MVDSGWRLPLASSFLEAEVGNWSTYIFNYHLVIYPKELIRAETCASPNTRSPRRHLTEQFSGRAGGFGNMSGETFRFGRYIPPAAPSIGKAK